MLTAAVILHLVEEGSVGLDDPVGMHIPGWSAADLRMGDAVCTVALLLSHQCGLETNPPLSQYAVLLDPIRRPDVRVPFLESVRKQPLRFAPGSDYLYSNNGYSLAGLIVLQHDDGTFDEIVRRRLFTPLELTGTGFAPGSITDFLDRVAPLSMSIGTHGLRAQSWLGLDEASPSWLGAAGGAFSTPSEMTTVFKKLIGGDLLSSSSRAQWLEPRVGTDSTDSRWQYGLGVGIVSYDDHTQIRHSGSLEPHGFSTHVNHIPEWDMTITVMSNRSTSVYTAADIATALINVMRAQPYVSPFPDGLAGWLRASTNGLIHTLVLPLLFLSILVSAFRPMRYGRVSLAMGLATRAWVVLFFRGLLGIHTGDSQVIGLSALLLLTVMVAVTIGLRRNRGVTRWPPKTARLGWVWAWSRMFVGLILMLFCAFLVGLFPVQIVLLLMIVAGVMVLPDRALAGSSQ